MELIIPTNDSLNIAPEFEKASGFRFITIINGLIKSDSLSFDKNNIINNTFPFLKDIVRTGEPYTRELIIHANNSKDPLYHKFVIVSSISAESEMLLSKNNFIVLKTTEKNITNAVMNHIESNVTNESDYCCYP
jgi:predicted Fe-Mo cluster-binding NifX family protein